MPDTKNNEPLFAIFNGGEEITEEMYQEVLDFFEYIKTKEAEKQKNRSGVAAPKR